jgi:hypothetical protein
VTTSTINPNTPASGGTLSSSVIRANWSAAVNDINTLYTLVGQIATAGIVYSNGTVYSAATISAPLSLSGLSLGLASQAASTVLGNAGTVSAVPSALTKTQITSLLNTFTTSLQGAVPSSGGGTTNFLRADGGWTAPPGTPVAGNSVTITSGNTIGVSAIASGMVSSNGTILQAATLGTGFSFASGTLSLTTGVGALLTESGTSAKISALTTASNPPTASATSLLYIPTVQEDGTNAKVSISNLMIAPNAVVSSGSVGVSLNMIAGNGDGTGNGGSVEIAAGAAGNGGTAHNGGTVYIYAGNAGTLTSGTGQVSGDVTIAAGNQVGTNVAFGGNVVLNGGNSYGTGTVGGAVELNGGNDNGGLGNIGGPVLLQGGTGIAGGAISLTAGNATSLTGGAINITGGNSGGNLGYGAGAINITGGNGNTSATGGAGGSVNITSGNALASANSYHGGDIVLTMGTGSAPSHIQGNLIITNLPGSYNASSPTAIWETAGFLVNNNVLPPLTSLSPGNGIAISGVGTISVQSVTAGVVSSNGTVLEATTLAGTLSWNAGTLTDGILIGTTGTIGGSTLSAGGVASGTVAVTGATTLMAVAVSPQTYPGDGFVWDAYVSSAGTVTVKVVATVAGTPTGSLFNVRVVP